MLARGEVVTGGRGMVHRVLVWSDREGGGMHVASYMLVHAPVRQGDSM
jgi:hypothetical protein